MLQAYYMAAPFAVERAPTVDLCCLRKYKDVKVAMLTEYPVCLHGPLMSVRLAWVLG